MENYRKTGTRQEDSKELNSVEIPIIKINANGKVKNYVNAANTHFKSRKDVYIIGIGQAINKAVSVAEIIAKNNNAILKTDIFEIKEVDVWESISGDLDDLEVTRHLPAIRLNVVLP